MSNKTVRSPGGLDLVTFYKTFYEIMGEIHGVTYTLESITHKETGEVLYTNDEGVKAG